MNASDLVKNKRTKLVLLQESAKTARLQKEQVYAEQAKEIEILLDKLTAPFPQAAAFKESIRSVVKSMFYDLPSQNVIAFLNRILQTPPKIFETAFNDFFFKVYLTEKNKRKKVSPRLFYAYLKSAMNYYDHKVQKHRKPLMGDSCE